MTAPSRQVPGAPRQVTQTETTVLLPNSGRPVHNATTTVTMTTNSVYHHQFGPNGLNQTVQHGGGEPARVVPPDARNAMRARAHQTPHNQTPSLLGVYAQQQADVRQIPGTNLAVVTAKRH